MTRLFTCLALILSLFIQANAQQNTNPSEVKGDLGRRADQYFTRLAEFGFAGSILVAKDGKVALHKGYGLANRAEQIAVTTDTVFDIASITKQFTAAAILKLEMSGKLKTSDSISRFFSNVPDDKASITLHHLLTHTSGLRAVLDGNDPVSRDLFIEGMLKTPLNSKPGEKFAYSNAGFTLLAAIIELVSNQSYEAFLTEHLFKPANMSNTGFYESKEKWAASQVARGYDEWRDRGAPTEWDKDYRFRGSSYVLTSAGDLFKWDQALRGKAMLSEEAKKKFSSAYTPAEQAGTSYGYGWNIAKTPRGTRQIGHDGIGFGFNSIYQRYVDEDTVVIVLSNLTLGRFLPVGPVERDLSEIIFEGKKTRLPESVAVDQSLLQKYAGTYELGSGAKLRVTFENKELQISAEGQGAIDILSVATEDERRRQDEFNRRANDMFLSMGRGDFEPFVREMKDRIPADDARKAISGLWKRFEDRHGQFKSLDVLGTVTEPEALMTYVRLNFEKGFEYRRMRWEGGKLAYILQTTFPLIPTVLAPRSQTEFFAYHLGLARLAHLRFDLDDRKEVVKLTFQISSEKTTARRIESDKVENAR